jgi:hypothetical protein
MLGGWRAQQKARGLRDATIAPRERLVRAFIEFASEYPWSWGPGHVEEWTPSLSAERHPAPSTIRGYQTDLRLFSEYLCDGRYGWAPECEKAFGPGAHPVPVCQEWNTIAHLNEYEGSPEARPFTREELQRFLDYADEQVERAVKAKRKGALAAYRDATLFKVIYGWPSRGSGLLSRSRVHVRPTVAVEGPMALRGHMSGKPGQAEIGARPARSRPGSASLALPGRGSSAGPAGAVGTAGLAAHQVPQELPGVLPPEQEHEAEL